MSRHRAEPDGKQALGAPAKPKGLVRLLYMSLERVLKKPLSNTFQVAQAHTEVFLLCLLLLWGTQIYLQR
jgi:hypothetical protein